MTMLIKNICICILYIYKLKNKRELALEDFMEQ